jgi:hypothetical protein
VDDGRIAILEWRFKHRNLNGNRRRQRGRHRQARQYAKRAGQKEMPHRGACVPRQEHRPQADDEGGRSLQQQGQFH